MTIRAPSVVMYSKKPENMACFVTGHKMRLQDVNNIKLGKHINTNLIVYDQCPSYWNIYQSSCPQEAPVIFCAQKTLKKRRVL